MSTNSTIAINRKDGTRTAIYCHWDGYIEGVGIILQLAYNTAEKVEELLALGDLSSLRYYPSRPQEAKDDTDVCIAYHRDRGEAFAQTDMQNEYNYTFDECEAVWYVEREHFIKDTAGQQKLGLGFYLSYPRTLLIDEIEKCDFRGWIDDEFANAQEVYEKCLQKALEARAKIIKDQQDQAAYYAAAYL